MLMAEDTTSMAAAEADLLQGLTEFSAQMAVNWEETSSGSSYFLGESFSAVDIALAPWYQRILSVSSTYCDFSFPTKHVEFDRLRTWYESVRQRQSFAVTCASEERLVKNYEGYANNTASSDVARRFRKKSCL
jgi:glutathione S-transferase